MIGAQSNSLQQARSAKVQASIRRVLQALQDQLEGLDQDLAQALRPLPAWREKEDLLTTGPGVGPQTARQLLINLPELGVCSR